MKAVIIDDDPLAHELIAEYLQHYPQIALVGAAYDGLEGVKAIYQHQPDLIFLDIQMPKINGFEMLELLEHPPAIIFTTAFEEYALRAFETHAVDYLLKPFSQERFNKALQKCLDRPMAAGLPPVALLETAQALSPPDRIVVRNGSKVIIVPIQSVHYLEGADDFVKIHTKEGIYLKKKTLQFFEDTLDKRQFVRVHRSYLVPIEQIVRIDVFQKDTYVALLRSGESIPVSRSGYPKLRALLGL